MAIHFGSGEHMNLKNALENAKTKLHALQVRERLMLLGLAVISVLAVAEAVWVAPALQRAQQARQALVNQQTALERLQAEAALQATSSSSSTLSPRAQLASVNAQIDGVEREINTLTPSQRDATTLRSVLENFLQRHEGLSLVRTSTLAADAPPIFASTSMVPVPADRRGLELTVAGPYPELVRYVQSLERALPDLRWGALVLSNQDSTGTQLTLQVFVVGGTP
jgi:MSHA biogenesis protein MshJ